MSELELLREALDHVDSAAYLLRKYVKLNPTQAGEVEDIIIVLEDAGEQIESLLSREERAKK